jgi:hypothetical protein
MQHEQLSAAGQSEICLDEPRGAVDGGWQIQMLLGGTHAKDCFGSVMALTMSNMIVCFKCKKAGVRLVAVPRQPAVTVMLSVFPWITIM